MNRFEKKFTTNREFVKHVVHNKNSIYLRSIFDTENKFDFNTAVKYRLSDHTFDFNTAVKDKISSVNKFDFNNAVKAKLYNEYEMI